MVSRGFSKEYATELERIIRDVIDRPQFWNYRNYVEASGLYWQLIKARNCGFTSQNEYRAHFARFPIVPIVYFLSSSLLVLLIVSSAHSEREHRWSQVCSVLLPMVQLYEEQHKWTFLCRRDW